MSFVDVKTRIGNRGVISSVGESTLLVDIPTVFSENISIAGSLTVSDDLDVTGSLNISGSLSIPGSLSVSGNLDVTGSLNVGSLNLAGGLSVPGSLSVSDDLNVTGSFNVSGGFSLDNSWFMITSLGDFPNPVGDVITLQDNGTYVVTREVDLSGSRLVFGRNTTLLGGSSENSRLKSTGLIGSPLITSEWSTPIRNITIEANLALNLDATGNSEQALDWFGVNFTDCQEVGLIRNYNNFIMNDSALLNSSGMVFDGAINTIAFDTCLLTGRIGSSSIILSSSLSVGRRFRAIYSSFIVPSGANGIEVQDQDSAFPINESFILDTINFSGDGVAVSGSSQASNRASFSNCVGLENSADIAQYYMNNNASITNTAFRNVFYKVQGATSPGAYVRKFELSNNRATYIGSRAGFYEVTAVASFSDGNNQDIAFRVALNGTTDPSSEVRANTGTGGRVESINAHGVVFLSSGSYVEIFAANNTSASGSLTVSELNTIITRLA